MVIKQYDHTGDHSSDITWIFGWSFFVFIVVNCKWKKSQRQLHTYPVEDFNVSDMIRLALSPWP